MKMPVSANSCKSDMTIPVFEPDKNLQFVLRVAGQCPHSRFLSG
jgi:hypothetical protein